MTYKILFVGHSPNLAGAEYSLLRLITQLKDKCDISVLAPPGGVFQKKITELEIPFYPFQPQYAFYLKHQNQGNLLTFLSNLTAEIEQQFNKLPKPDIIHTNTSMIWEGAFLAEKWKIPHVWNLREIISDSPTWQPFFSMNSQYLLMEQLTDHFVCVSKALRDSLPKPLKLKASVVHNGMTQPPHYSRDEARKFFEKEFNIKPEQKVLLTVGNFIPEKGHSFLFNLVPKLIERMPELVFLWVGAKHFEYTAINRLIHEKGLESHIIIPGHVEHFGNYMKGADLYLLSSETEAFPTVILESIIAGVPVIARDCGGAREILEYGGGFSIDKNDDQAFQEKIIQVLNKNVTIPPIPKEPIFEMAKMSSSYDQTYEKILKEFQINPSRTTLLNDLFAFASSTKSNLDELKQYRMLQQHSISRKILRILKFLFLK